MSVPIRKPVLAPQTLKKAPVREHPVAPESAAAPTAEQPAVAERPTPAGPRMGMLSVRIDLDLRQDIKRYAVDREVTVQTVIEDALRDYLARRRAR